MRKIRISWILVPLALAIGWACVKSEPTAESPATPIMLTGGDCYTPTSWDLAVDSVAFFWRTGDCGTNKLKVTLTWANPQTPARVGFGIASPCNKQVDYRTGLLKVVRCATGAATLTIYSDSAGTSVLQTIPIADDLP